MKQIALSIEQMQRLEELGLSTIDASMFWTSEMKYITRIDEVGGFKYEDIIDDIVCYIFTDEIKVQFLEKNLLGHHANKKIIPAYTLQDILEKLPEFVHLGPFQSEFRCVCKLGPNVESKHGDTMLEAAYNMLILCLENNYIKKV